jgi:predicted ATPase/class 3 adenylate cyclase
MASELEQLKAGIASLEAQRSALGDVVVDLALAPLRAKLAALAQAASSSADGAQKLKQVTILFLDVVGSTSLSEKLDPEEISAVMDGALARGTEIVSSHRGKVLQYAGDNLLAVFGADEVSEDDTECAVLCGLALLAEGRALGADVARRHGYAGLNVRVGVHTGGVLLGGGVDAEGTIRGSAVNIAARMEQTAPPGGLRISNDTFQHVRGVFEVEQQPPLHVKGVDAPMITYLVLRAKPRGFRTGTRGIEGVETRMVGREAEFQVLQDAFTRLHRERSLAFVTVVAEAGVGKSRLLLEFEQWVQGSGERFSLFQGRADPQTEGRPFGLLRDVIAWRLQIADDDSMAVAKDKVEQGIVPLFTEEGPELAQSHAHLLGHLIGLDFSDSRYVKGILEDPKQIRARGFHAAAQVFRRLVATDGVPILLQLDDLHWADDGSLEFLMHLARVNRDVPMLVIGLTRATLFERASDWSSIEDIHQRIDLSPLDKVHSQMLAGELLKKLPEVPAALSELIMGRAEGNPFYMEELVKMLVDQGALEIGVDLWTLHPERLLATRVPATLTGVLQARLDSLPADERLALQQASVIGLVFWDQALAALDTKAPLALPALERRELALPHKEASLDGMREYAFRHQILHEVTYGTLLKRARRELHGRAAAWLVGATGARASDFLGVIAEHYEKAGDRSLACEFYTRAAEQSRKRYAHEAATGYVDRALALIGDDPGDDTLGMRWRLLDVRERTLELQGRRPQQRADLDVLQQLADALDDDRRRAELATRRSLLALRTGDYRSQESAARNAMELAARAQDHDLRLNAQRLLADALTRLGDSTAGREMAEKGLAESRVRGLSSLEGRFLNALTIIAGRQQDLVAMLELSQRATELRRAMGDHRNEAIGLSSLGTGWLELGELELARRHLEDALRLHRSVGDRALEPIVLANLSQLELWEGNKARAREHALAALDIAEAVQAADLQVLALWSMGNAELAAKQCIEAAQTFERAQAVACAIDSALQHDATAGTARVALSVGDFAAALQAIEPLLSRLERDVTLEGTLGTRLIQLTCYQVLAGCKDSRAGAVLERVHASLQERAATITDPRLRERFLTAVPENREIVAAWEAANQAISEALAP